jgi:hypothetical protein
MLLVAGACELKLGVSKSALHIGVDELADRRRVQQRFVRRLWNVVVLINIAIDELKFQDLTNSVVTYRYDRA